MSASGYDAVPDPYCYPGTTVLINILDIRDQDRLDEFEKEMVTARSDRPLLTGDLDEAYYRTLHRHLFGGIYAWAGEYRTIRIAKGDSMFCYPEYIAPETEHLFAWLESRNFLADLSIDEFAIDAAHFLATLNAIHAFREGNGRTQLSFMTILATRAGHPLRLARLDPDKFLEAMILSFNGDEAPLADQVLDLVGGR